VGAPLVVTHLTLEAGEVVIDVGARRAWRRGRGVPGVPEVVPQVIVVVVADLAPAALAAHLAATAVGGDLVHDVSTACDERGDQDVAEHRHDQVDDTADDQEGNQRADRDGCDLEPVHSGAPFSSPSIIIRDERGLVVKRALRSPEQSKGPVHAGIRH
jgi:hypothetical protein